MTSSDALALLVMATTIAPARRAAATAHLRRLASRRGHSVRSMTSGPFEICWVERGTGHQNETHTELPLTFVVGRIGSHPLEWDRHLSIGVESTGLTITTDYAGSIPGFYSHRDGLVFSTVEPCTWLASGSTLDDLSAERVFGYLRYSHFIWEETAWQHIDQILPDSEHRLGLDGTQSCRPLDTIRASDSRAGLTDKAVASELCELNESLVRRSLSDAGIVLPLSAGYDSRMIFAVIAGDASLRAQTQSFTYGSEGSIEVESARRLCEQAGVDWQFVDLPCRFLSRDRLTEIGDIFGASLHVHGMYQLEFFDLIAPMITTSPARLTSGFMTGVPAGQHNGLLQIGSENDSLTTAMDRFRQSNFWTDDELAALPFFDGRRYRDAAEARFRAAFDRFDGEVWQKAVMFDVWTRQRNFISYYPKTMEWVCETASPHMCPEYPSFFMSLGREHLWDRRAVELMFNHCYPKTARIASNSNGLKALGNPLETLMLKSSRLLAPLGLTGLLPRAYRNAPFEFDISALRNGGRAAIFPLESDETRALVAQFGGDRAIAVLDEQARQGDEKSYCRLADLQALGLNFMLATRA